MGARLLRVVVNGALELQLSDPALPGEDPGRAAAGEVPAGDRDSVVALRPPSLRTRAFPPLIAVPIHSQVPLLPCSRL